MSKYRFFIFFWLLISLLFGCAGEKKDGGNRKEEPTVVVSVAPQAWFVDQIAGDLVQTHVMVPNGTNPEEYDPAPRDIAALEESDLFIYTGTLPFEMVWVERLSALEKREVNVSERLPHSLLYPEEEGEGDAEGHSHPLGDPHFWSSFEGGEILARITYEELLSLLPGDSLLLKEGYQRLDEKIKELKEEAFAALGKEGTPKAFLIYHPSLTAFSKETGLTQIAIEYEGKEPAPGRLALVTEEAVRLGAEVMLIQAEFNPENARSIARQIGAKTVEINPYDSDWERQMRLLIHALTGEE